MSFRTGASKELDTHKAPEEKITASPAENLLHEDIFSRVQHLSALWILHRGKGGFTLAAKRDVHYTKCCLRQQMLIAHGRRKKKILSWAKRAKKKIFLFKVDLKAFDNLNRRKASTPVISVFFYYSHGRIGGTFFLIPTMTSKNSLLSMTISNYGQEKVDSCNRAPELLFVFLRKKLFLHNMEISLPHEEPKTTYKVRSLTIRQQRKGPNRNTHSPKNAKLKRFKTKENKTESWKKRRANGSTYEA
ncbi:hypothetical protein OSB04_001224 [Centaurea solstitialis]|uniref:Uncharacterized protein n=1 Tax=Centaurea solstitialis TaxID=347529 RepID=A0AA38TQL4_9ASTR|nr:hypothetical protein OSB04_001224 [Centaurea solstitialis]